MKLNPGSSWKARCLAVVVVPFVLLLSYYAVMLFMPLTPTQQQTWDYLQGEGPNRMELPYTEQELRHLDDVKQVMSGVKVSFAVLALLVLGISWRYGKDKAFLQQWVRWGGIYTVACTILVLLGLLVGFDSLFTLFHRIFFPQGNWQFAADSLLIMAFPGKFFVTIALFIFGLSFLLGVILFLLGLRKPFIPRIFS